MEGHAQKCVERYCELANKTVEQLYNVSSPCLNDHQFKQEELESVAEVSEVCSQIVLNSLYLARIGRPVIVWSVNKLASSVTKWTQACDRRLARLTSYSHHANALRQYRHVGNTALHCRSGPFQDSDFAGGIPRFLFRENLFYVTKENWDRSTRAPGTKLKFGKERVHPSRGIIQKCAPLEYC